MMHKIMGEFDDYSKLRGSLIFKAKLVVHPKLQLINLTTLRGVLINRFLEK